MAEENKKEAEASKKEGEASVDGKAGAASATSEGQSPGRSKKKIIILAFLGLLLLGLGGGAAYFFLFKGSKHKKDEAGVASSKAGHEENKEDHGEGTHDEKDKKESKEEHGKGQEAKDHDDEKSKEGGPTKLEIDFGETYVLQPFHLNLGNPLENHYIRIEVSLEYRGGPEQKQELETRLPQLRDAVISVSSRKTREFLLGPDGKDQLRLEILTRINQYMDRKIESVFITEFLVE